MEPHVPSKFKINKRLDEIRYRIRLPSRWAESQPRMTYLDKIQKETQKFMDAHIKHNYLAPENDVSLNIKIPDAEIMFNADPKTQAFAESGELRNLAKKCTDLEDQAEGCLETVQDSIARILSQIEEQEKADPVTPAQLNAKFKLATLSMRLFEGFTKHVSDDLASSGDLKAAQASYNKLQGKVTEAAASGASSEFDSAINDIEAKLVEALGVFSEYEKATVERERWYHGFLENSESEALDSFRSELLKHLAGNIVIGEHRMRYQQEQYVRFNASMSSRQLFSTKGDMNTFCRNYALLIEHLISLSHGGMSPKIEANYDEYSEQTIRPINATIFYYFFSMDRCRKSMASWFLSAARYPNERTRRAYMSFFA